eukprot:scaffold1767_cov64-Attheya_sp.AAC.4
MTEPNLLGSDAMKSRVDEMENFNRKRKLRPLVITMGSTRQEHIEKMFAHPKMSARFEKPVFSPGIPSRELRNRLNLLHWAHEAGILPETEWEVIQASVHSIKNKYDTHLDALSELLKHVEVDPDRKGAESYRELPYSIELWRKAKGLNRDRSVLACTLAHLIAMRTCVEQEYDFILEDNVRVPLSAATMTTSGTENDPETYDTSILCECAERIWDAKEASEEWGRNGQECHLRYYGWLGSIPNLKWVIQKYAQQSMYRQGDTEKNENENDSQQQSRTNNNRASVFPFPTVQDYENLVAANENANDLIVEEDAVEEEAEVEGKVPQTPGGTPVWGAYAYWVSRRGLDMLLEDLRLDVGALVWKGKRMRCHIAKPIDKILPRRIMALLGKNSVHLTTRPAFFRAPMLTSKIHTQYDSEFCRSTEYQLKHCSGDTENALQQSLSWGNLWLSEDERAIVLYKEKSPDRVWITQTQLSELKESNR